MGFIEDLGYSIGGPLDVLAREFIYKIDDIFVMAIIVFFGYLLGWVLGHIVTHSLRKMKFSDKFKTLHLAKPLEKVKFAALIGWVVKWYTFVVFTATGAGYVNLYPVTDIITKFALWFPRLVVAMAIGVGGVVLAEFIFDKIMHVKVKEANILASLAKYSILIIAVTMALDQIIEVSVLESTMLIVVAGLSFGIALALGISFGIALKDDAASWVAGFKRK